MTEHHDYSLRGHNTFGIEARCGRFLEYASADEARDAAAMVARDDTPPLIIGSGSNLLLTADYPGTVVHSAIRGMEPLPAADADTVMLRVGSGELWDDVVARCVDEGWHGAENLSLIPGEAGASVVQNIGAYGAEVCQLAERIEAVDITDGRPVSIAAADCRYAYRQSRFKQEWRSRYLITHVVYRLQRRFTPLLDYGNLRQQLAARDIGQPTARQLRQLIIDIRREKLPDPAVEGNAGSFFMNPVVDRGLFGQLLERYPQMPHYAVDAGHEKIPAGWLIEQCGWKGRSLGPAGVHSRQALVLVNRGGATGRDIVALAEAVRHDVRRQFGIEINPEVNIV